MELVLLPLSELTDTHLAAWRTLATRAVERNPFFEPDFLVPALEHLDDAHAVKLLLVSDGDDARLALPMLRSRSWRGIPVSALVSWRHAYCVLGTPLVDRDFLRPSLEQLLDRLAGRRQPRVSVLDWIGDGPVLDALTELVPPDRLVNFSSFERPMLRRRPDGNYLEVLSRHRRKRLAQQRRQLERDLGPVHVVDRAQDPEAREQFLRLEAAGWKGTAGTAMASQPSHASFFRDMAVRFADAGRLELASLETAGGLVLAMAMRLRAGDTVFQLKIAYDERYGRYGPGRALDVALLQTFHDTPDEEWVDSCTDPGNEFKAALYPERRTIRTVLIPGRGRVNAGLAHALPEVRRSKHRFDGFRRAFSGRLGKPMHQPMQDAATATQPAEEPGPTLETGPGVPALRVESEPVTDLDAATMRAWETLAERASEPNPFFAPALAVAAARNLTSGHTATLLCVYDADEMVFAAPVIESRRWRRLRIRAVRTWCHPQCFFGAPLVVDDDRAVTAWRLVFDRLASCELRPRILILELLPMGGHLEAGLRRAASGRQIEQYETYARASLDRSSLGGDIAPQRGRRRRELERRSRQVERVTGAAFATRDVAGTPGAVEGFLGLEEASWTGRAGTALASDPGTAAFALEGAQALHDRGQLVLLATTAGTGLAAELFAIRDRETLFMFKIAYAEDLARFSPGTHLVHDMVTWFADDPTLSHIDSCAHPANMFINRLLPDRRRLATVLVALDPGVGMVATKLLPRLVAFSRRVRRISQ
jgi:CelD/BcsL family acetyltransferase involved in cellulose biosynthesis